MTLHAICQYEDAISCFDSILSVQKDNPQILYKKAITVLKQGNVLGSINILRRIVEIDPVYKEIIKKEIEFNRLKENPLFKETIKEKTEFDKIDEDQFNISSNKTTIIEHKL